LTRWNKLCRAYAAGVKRTYLSKLEKAASYPGLEIIAHLVIVCASSTDRSHHPGHRSAAAKMLERDFRDV